MPAGHATITEYEMRRKGYLLVAEAARKIHVTPQTIYRWIADSSKGVEGFRDGYRRYVRWSTILKHLGPDAVRVRELTQEDIWTETHMEAEGA